MGSKYQKTMVTIIRIPTFFAYRLSAVFDEQMDLKKSIEMICHRWEHQTYETISSALFTSNRKVQMPIERFSIKDMRDTKRSMKRNL